MPTVLITGASRGLGLEFCRQYGADGWTVIPCCRNPADADALNALAHGDDRLRLMALDVADAASRDTLAAELGDTAIDLLINNAGIYTGADTRDGDDTQDFGTLDEAAWLRVLRTNTVAPILLIEALLPNVRRGNGKRIVNITSRMGSLTEMGAGSLAYRSSKAALNAAMRVILHDLQRDGIAIANLHPGWVQTDMGGKGAQLTPPVSVTAMRATIAALTPDQTGAFLNYDGKTIAW